jgi:hypothetical protein
VTTTRTRRHPLIVLPSGTITGIEPFVAEAAEIDPSVPGPGAWATDGHIELGWVSAGHTLMTGAKCAWHDDGGNQPNDPTYSALLVLRNDANSWVETREPRKYPEQPIGTLVLLDITRKHRLTCQRPAPPLALWVALWLDYVEVPTPERCMADMQRLVDQAGEKEPR